MVVGKVGVVGTAGLGVGVVGKAGLGVGVVIIVGVLQLFVSLQQVVSQE